MTNRSAAAASSAIWAAYGDALGWISELTDEAGLKRRTGGEPLLDVIPWRRRVGGQGGVTVNLPQGTYSDDTQLRLSVCRAIGPAGFDVEVFSRIEMTVWPSYALGGGKGTKTAAAAMARPDARWSINQPVGYEKTGGNGAAMRIQPHVWRPERSTPDLLGDVLKDAVVTHGHPRGILGAALHALTLADLMPGAGQRLVSEGTRSWSRFATELLIVGDLPYAEPEFANFWLPAWSECAQQEWKDAAQSTVREIQADLGAVSDIVTASESFKEGYRDSLKVLDLYRPAHRGSGTRTVIAAMAGLNLSLRFDVSPHAALTTMVNELGSDTDTIASMAGAYLGAIHDSRPPTPPMDWRYIVREAQRVATGPTSEGSVRYPDLLVWEPPRAQADAFAYDEDGPVVAGLGRVRELDEPVWNNGGDFGWQSVETSFNQTLLIKRRREPGLLSTENRSAPAPPREAPLRGPTQVRQDQRLPGLDRPPSEQTVRFAHRDPASALDQALIEVRQSRFDACVVGRLLQDLTRRFGPGVGGAFGALVAQELNR